MHAQGRTETKRRTVAKRHESYTTPSRKTAGVSQLSRSRRCMNCVAKAIFPPFCLNALRMMQPTPSPHDNPPWITPKIRCITNPQLDPFERSLKRCSSIWKMATSKPDSPICIEVRIQIEES
ncbi:hypothetical protein AB1N83_013164 [Pleurotus pulmonarius]